jgi:hypothetical protein
MAGVFVVALVALIVRRKVHAKNKLPTQNGCGGTSSEPTCPKEGRKCGYQ